MGIQHNFAFIYVHFEAHSFRDPRSAVSVMITMSSANRWWVALVIQPALWWIFAAVLHHPALQVTGCSLKGFTLSHCKQTNIVVFSFKYLSTDWSFVAPAILTIGINKCYLIARYMCSYLEASIMYFLFSYCWDVIEKLTISKEFQCESASNEKNLGHCSIVKQILFTTKTYEREIQQYLSCTKTCFIYLKCFLVHIVIFCEWLFI